LVQVVGPGTQVLRSSQTVPAWQSWSPVQVVLGTHWWVVGWQNRPALQSSLVVQSLPLPPLPPDGWHE